MGDPTQDQVNVAIQALRTDAGTWTRAAGQLRDAQNAASPLNLTEFDFSFAGDKTGITRVYGQLKDKMTRLLGEGAAEFDGLSKALTDAANGYEKDDQDNYHRLNKIW